MTKPSIKLNGAVSAVAIALASLALASFQTQAASFTPGNLVVERVGDGVLGLTNNGNTIFFDEITSNGAAVQTIQIPNTGASPLVEAPFGSIATDGGISLSADGKSVVFPGYVADLPSASNVETNFAPNVPRGIGRLDTTGAYKLAALSYTNYGNSTIRGAASDGVNNFWASGTYSSQVAANGGLWYMGSNSLPAQVYYTSNAVVKTANLRTVGTYNGNLWFSAASSTSLGYGIFEFAGMPTTTIVNGVTAPNVVGPNNGVTNVIKTTANDSIYGFAVSPDGSVIYYSDDGSLLTANGGIHKFTETSTAISSATGAYVAGGVWASNTIFGISSTATNPCYGIAVNWSTLPVTIYATTGSGLASNSVIKILDTGSGSTATVIANTGTTNKIYRGVSFTPATTQPWATPVAPTIASLSTGNFTTNAGSFVSIYPTGTTGTPISSNLWYQITGSTTNLVASGSSAGGAALVFTNLQPSNAGGYFLILSNANGTATSSVVILTVSNSPNILSITPSGTFTNTVGTSQTLTLQTDSGFPVASNFWYYINGNGTATNLITWEQNFTTTAITLTNLQLTNAGSYFAVLSNAFGSVTSSVVNMGIFIPVPVITGITPAPSNNPTGVPAGATIPFVLNAYQGNPLASNFWYKITGNGPFTTNLISTVFNYTITNAVPSNSASYFAILTNIYGATTSAVVTIAVTNDLNIIVEPSSAQGLVKGQVQFSVVAGGTLPLHYQWYFSDTNGNIVAPVSQLGDGSVLSGTNLSTLTFSNLQPADLTNFVVVITNVDSMVTSTVASTLPGNNNLVLPTTNGVLALWDFDGSNFVYNAYFLNYIVNPAPFIGNGTASVVGTCYNPGPTFGVTPPDYSPGPGSADGFDQGFDPNVGQYVETPYGFNEPSPNGSWGTENYPATNGVNKANGVQFSVSTVGSRNIKVAYDSRVSGTASEYDRLQYTTNGTTWIDYPASSTFNGVASTYFGYDYDLTGFPGVDNNPNFGVRVVTEWQSTATYQTPATSANTNLIGVNNVKPVNWWVGAANSYVSGAISNSAPGTVTYDLVAITGDAITNNNVPPTMNFATLVQTNGLSFTNMVDTNTLVVNFSAGSAQMPATNLTFTEQVFGTQSGSSGPGFPAVYLPATISPTFVVSNTGLTSFTLAISFPPGQYIPDSQDGAPVLITATDTNGESTATWFGLTVASINQPPTNSLTSLPATNTLANTTLTLPFTVGSARNGYTNLTYQVTSGNTTVIPTANIILGGNTNTGQLTLTITPAANQVGNAPITVTVFDHDPIEPRSTVANLAFLVLPNTNIVAVDFFNYANNGGLDAISGGYWGHLSGIFGQLQVQGGLANVDTADNTENVQATLLGNGFTPGSGTVLYSSFTVNIGSQMPVANGSYFETLNDGSGNTANVECSVVAATNGAAPGYYRLGISNTNGATAPFAQMFPQDLAPYQTYVVVTALNVANGQSTIWVSPTNQASPSVTDLTGSALYTIKEVELRQSGKNAGAVAVGNLMVGKSFNSVFYPVQANPDNLTATENATNLLNVTLNDGGWNLQVTNVSETDGNGTSTNNGGYVQFTPVPGFTGTATIYYTAYDNLGNSSSSMATVTVADTAPTANPVTATAMANTVNNPINVLSSDVLNTPGGTLSLVSASETDGHGSVSTSGNTVLFTPTAGFTGTATVSYTIQDGLGGSNSSTITVTVISPSVNAYLISGGNLVITWSNATFGLQFATNVTGPFVTIPGATSPFTNLVTTNAAGFYRLKY